MEKETAEAVGQAAKLTADSGVLTWIGGIIATAFGFLITRYHRSIGHRISAVGQAAASAAAAAEKADKLRREDVNALHQKLDEHLQRDADMHSKIMEKLSEIPTRDEVERIVHRRRS